MKESLHIENVLKEKGIYISTTIGSSMCPMLRSCRDTIIIRPVNGRLKKYDIPLYKRGKKYILHRIVKVVPNGYVICGDNCLNKEYLVTDRQIIGVLNGFYRDNKEIDMNGIGYRSYCRLWVALYPIRYIIKRLGMFARTVVKKVKR